MRERQGQLRFTAGTSGWVLGKLPRRGEFDTARQAFTLVELLVVGVIIVVLMAMTLFAMSAVTRATKETKTRATIQKLDVALQQIFETYEWKAAIIRSKVARDYPGIDEEVLEAIVAHFIRDTMRMEMPHSWAEVYNSAAGGGGVLPKLGPIEIELDGMSAIAVRESPVLDFYWEVYAERQAAGKPPGRGALLFLIIQNLNPEALEAFHGSEVADTDGDGLLEFVDAWGKPIHFLRWAPAFPGGGGGGGLQQDVLSLAEYVPQISGRANASWWRDGYRREGHPLWEAMRMARTPPVGAADPFDGRSDATGWFLYPLIYSAGPDGKYDIVSERIDPSRNPMSPRVRPGSILDPFAFPFGMPGDFDGNGVLNHFDNIHNHQWYKTY